jgi:hypothetical protein
MVILFLMISGWLFYDNLTVISMANVLNDCNIYKVFLSSIFVVTKLWRKCHKI